MKKYLLPKEGTFYKANLHTHTTVSDGQLTPDEAKEAYKCRGYSVLAYTDHDVMIPHHELADENFLPLTGYEMEVTQQQSDFFKAKTCHMCLIAKEPEMDKQICWHRNYYLFGNALNYKNQVKFDENEPDYDRVYTAECVNDMMKRGREAGFFVTYNHPTWSVETYEEYIHYDQMDAMEIANYVCQLEGFEEYNPRVYDDFLMKGRRIYCIGGDDCHEARGVGGAWTMIKAEKLEYRTITKALEDGHFYASQGPEIYELWVEDGKLHITTSDACLILFSCGNRCAKRFEAAEGAVIHEASYEINPESIYVRVTVVDHKGRKANTNAYFIDMLDI